MGLVFGGTRTRGLVGGAPTGWSGSVPMGPSGMPRGDARTVGSSKDASTGGGRGRSVHAGRVGHGGDSQFRRPGSRLWPWARPCVWYVIRGVNCRAGEGGGCRWTVRSGEEEARDRWGAPRGSPRPLPLPVAKGQGVRVSVRNHEVRTRVLGRRCPQWLRRGAHQEHGRRPSRRGCGVARQLGWAGRPMSSTGWPAPNPCPRGGPPAGPRGSTISVGRGRTGPATTGILDRNIPGRRSASGSPPVMPSSPPHQGG